MKSKLLILQHAAWRGPGRLLLDLVDQLSIEVLVVEVWREKIPEDTGFDALILLGGGELNGEDKDEEPFCRDEEQFIHAWLALDKPCLGFCLGHHLLVDIFQAKVEVNFMPSMGFIEGHLTHDGREHSLFKGMGPSFSLFKWHRQAIQTPVPHDYILLATSKECVVEAFTIKGRPHIIGLQCDHHAAHPDDVGKWLASDEEWLGEEPWQRISSSDLLLQAEQSLAANRAVFTQLITNFMSLVND